jgi:RES domain-containing protein
MEAYRLTRQKYAGQLSGKGAAIKGGRWNSVGVEMLYLAANRSLAMAEVAVHLSIGTLPGDYLMVTVHIPDDIGILELPKVKLPSEWRDFPHPSSTQQFGDRFVADAEYAILKVPSVVTSGDFNLLANPKHPDFGRILIVEEIPFPFDRRLWK